MIVSELLEMLQDLVADDESLGLLEVVGIYQPTYPLTQPIKGAVVDQKYDHEHDRLLFVLDGPTGYGSDDVWDEMIRP